MCIHKYKIFHNLIEIQNAINHKILKQFQTVKIKRWMNQTFLACKIVTYWVLLIKNNNMPQNTR